MPVNNDTQISDTVTIYNPHVLAPQSILCNAVCLLHFFYSQTSNSDLLVNLSLKETEDNFLNSESICLRLSMLKSYGGKGKKRELHQLMLDFPLH